MKQLICVCAYICLWVVRRKVSLKWFFVPTQNSVCLNYAWTAQQNTLSCVCMLPFCWSMIIHQWLQVCCISSYSTQTCHVMAEMLLCWLVTVEFLVQAWVRLWTAVINLIQATIIFIFSFMTFVYFNPMLYKILYTGDRNHYNLCHNLRQFLGYVYYCDIKSENSLS